MDFVIALCDTPQGQVCPDLGEKFVTRRLAIAGPGRIPRLRDRAHHAPERALRHGSAPHRDLHEPAVCLPRSHGAEEAPRRDRRHRPHRAVRRRPCALASMAWAGSGAWRCVRRWAVCRADGDPRAGNRLEIVHLNELKGGAAATAHLLEFDSVHGRWHGSFGVEDECAIRDRQPCSASVPRRIPATYPGATLAATSCSSAPASS